MNNIKPEAVKKILKNYNEILEAEKNNDPNLITFNSIKELKEYFKNLEKYST